MVGEPRGDNAHLRSPWASAQKIAGRTGRRCCRGEAWNELDLCPRPDVASATAPQRACVVGFAQLAHGVGHVGDRADEADPGARAIRDEVSRAERPARVDRKDSGRVAAEQHIGSCDVHILGQYDAGHGARCRALGREAVSGRRRDHRECAGNERRGGTERRDREVRAPVCAHASNRPGVVRLEGLCDLAETVRDHAEPAPADSRVGRYPHVLDDAMRRRRVEDVRRSVRKEKVARRDDGVARQVGGRRRRPTCRHSAVVSDRRVDLDDCVRTPGRCVGDEATHDEVGKCATAAKQSPRVVGLGYFGDLTQSVGDDAEPATAGCRVAGDRDELRTAVALPWQQRVRRPVAQQRVCRRDAAIGREVVRCRRRATGAHSTRVADPRADRWSPTGDEHGRVGRQQVHDEIGLPAAGPPKSSSVVALQDFRDQVGVVRERAEPACSRASVRWDPDELDDRVSAVRVENVDRTGPDHGVGVGDYRVGRQVDRRPGRARRAITAYVPHAGCHCDRAASCEARRVG